ncbi:hypothetical protein [Streptomyces sp. NBC_00199]|uniref:hypothetical protein n=1 Tax=Streptomyces sp. NBC_00199 TaxID=2975678 RepID=UPI00224E2EAF|nr:hypothetical protein [Streptomyces sp. NBC_00199]MCX5265765.1 hypothetical protein [Streptomyces sp. NBC_00199]
MTPSFQLRNFASRMVQGPDEEEMRHDGHEPGQVRLIRRRPVRAVSANWPTGTALYEPLAEAWSMSVRSGR